MRRYRKWIFVLLSLLLCVLVARQHRSLSAERALGRPMAQEEAFATAPPVLALTTVALGGFRGLIANALWIRAIRLQDEGRYFELVTLSDWITKLQPDNSVVWAMQAWNMTYNISVQFESYSDRWLWVRSGMELLRDEGLRYNPDSVDLYRELAWFFQDKIGSNTDHAHWVYKEAWAGEMVKVVGRSGRLEGLSSDRADVARARVQTLGERYKMDLTLMQQIDHRYGPLDWRTPDAHAIYWSIRGLQNLKHRTDLLPLRRVVWQSVQRSFHRGRLVENQVDRRVEFAPNLDMAENVNRTFEEMKRLEPDKEEYVARAQRHFVGDAISFMYSNSRQADAMRWFELARENFRGMVPEGMTLDEFVVDHVTSQVEKGKMGRIVALLEGLMGQHYYHLALGDDDRANGYALLTRRVWERYQARNRDALGHLSLPSIESLRQRVREQIRNGGHGFSAALRAQLESQSGVTGGREVGSEGRSDSNPQPRPKSPESAPNRPRL